MSSWFILEFEADWAGDNEGASFGLVLDTTAPQVVWQQPSYEAEPNQVLEIPFTLTEADLLDALLRIDGDEIPLTTAHAGLDYTAYIPGRSEAGLGHLVLRVRDDVGNFAERSIAITFGDYVPPEEPETPIESGGGHPFTLGAGQPITGEPFEEEHEALLDLTLDRFETSFTGSLSFCREFAIEMEGTVSASRQISLAFSGQRSRADSWNRVLQDEDDLLAILL